LRNERTEDGYGVVLGIRGKRKLSDSFHTLHGVIYPALSARFATGVEGSASVDIKATSQWMKLERSQKRFRRNKRPTTFEDWRFQAAS
jgi:hypothetical protein